jgi:hypothetical protein
MHLLTERFIFWGDDRGFLKGGVKAYLMAPMSSLNSPFFLPVFTSIVYGSTSDQECQAGNRIYVAVAPRFTEDEGYALARVIYLRKEL